MRARLLRRDDARGELPDLGVRVGQKRQHLVVARLRLGEQRPERRDRRVLDAVGVVAAVRQKRADLRLVGILRQHLHGAEADLLVVVVEGLERDPGHPRRCRRLDDREGLLAQGRGVARGQGPGDPRQRPLVRVLAKVVERRVHDDRIRVPEEALEALGEVAAGQRLQGLHRPGAGRPRSSRRGRERSRSRWPRTGTASGTRARPAAGRRRTRPPSRRGRPPRGPAAAASGLQDLVALDLRLPGARTQLAEEGLGAGCPFPTGPHGNVNSV